MLEGGNMIKHIIYLIALTFINLLASDQQIHQHGLAKGSMIIQGTQLVIQLNIPAVDVVGFEYSPQNKKEQEKVQSALNQLKKKQFFNFYTKSKWLSRSKQIKLILVKDNVVFNFSSLETGGGAHHDHQKHSKHTHHHSNNHKNHDVQDMHAEFLIERTYVIKEPVSIYEISTLIFKELINLESLDFRIVTNSDQLVIDFDKTKISDRLLKPILISDQ